MDVLGKYENPLLQGPLLQRPPPSILGRDGDAVLKIGLVHPYDRMTKIPIPTVLHHKMLYAFFGIFGIIFRNFIIIYVLSCHGATYRIVKS